MIFSRKAGDNKIPNITLYNDSIIPKKEAVYLGVLLDSKLNYTNHINKARRKACAVMRALYTLICCKSKMTESNKIKPGGIGPSIGEWTLPWSALGVSAHLASGAPD